MTERSDIDLLQASGAGDGYILLFRRHVVPVLRYARSLSSSREDAEDLVQDAFFLLWQKRGSIRLASDSALPWLLTTTKFMALNRSRLADNRAVTLDHESLDRVVESQSPAGVAELQYVMDDISKLSPVDQRLCQLCLVEGLTYGEAAERLGLSRTAVAKRIERSRGWLRKARLERENGY